MKQFPSISQSDLDGDDNHRCMKSQFLKDYVTLETLNDMLDEQLKSIKELMLKEIKVINDQTKSTVNSV